MRVVEDFYEELKNRYGKTIPFKKICQDEGIIAVKTALEDGLDGISFRANGIKVMLLNKNSTKDERRDFAFHEMWHLLKSPTSQTTHHPGAKGECKKADLFAALCRIPTVHAGDDISSLQDKWCVSVHLAKLRLEHELKKLSR